MVAAVVGTIFTGAIFGDHTSPISDTTVLSATFTGADLIDHVRTQIYYAITVGLVAIALLLIWGVTRISPLFLLLIGVVALVVLVYGLSELDARRKGVSPVPASVPHEKLSEGGAVPGDATGDGLDVTGDSEVGAERDSGTDDLAGDLDD